MKNMVYEHKVDTRDELLQRIFNAARCIHDASVLCKVTLSIVE
jgi:transcription elongation factor Elf1